MNILVAGVGNIFLGDDGFGCAVAAALNGEPGVTVRDFGIRGFDLAYALTAGIDAAVLIDAVARGGAPGTLYVIEPAVDALPAALDNHAMDPVAVLRLAHAIGEPPKTIWVVGCEPARLGGPDDDVAVGLSEIVAAQIAPAATLVRELLAKLGGAACTS